MLARMQGRRGHVGGSLHGDARNDGMRGLATGGPSL